MASTDKELEKLELAERLATLRVRRRRHQVTLDAAIKRNDHIQIAKSRRALELGAAEIARLTRKSEKENAMRAALVENPQQPVQSGVSWYAGVRLTLGDGRVINRGQEVPADVIGCRNWHSLVQNHHVSQIKAAPPRAPVPPPKLSASLLPDVPPATHLQRAAHEIVQRLAKGETQAEAFDRIDSKFHDHARKELGETPRTARDGGFAAGDDARQESGLGTFRRITTDYPEILWAEVAVQQKLSKKLKAAA